MNDDGLPPLREVIANFDLIAKKNLGQNFLFDFNLLQKIATAGGDVHGRTVIEVGAGPGGLTRALLKAGARQVVAIEKDERFLPALQHIAARYPGRLSIEPKDAFDFDFTPFLAEKPVLVANLPYNVATPLLCSWLERPRLQDIGFMSLMFQKEVAERLVAPVGGKTYGRLSVLCQALCEVEMAFIVPAQAFVPVPKVDSAVVRLVPRLLPSDFPHPALSEVARAAFSQRRKMLRKSLQMVAGVDAVALAESLGIQTTLRAENVPVTDYIRLARAVLEARR